MQCSSNSDRSTEDQRMFSPIFRQTDRRKEISSNKTTITTPPTCFCYHFASTPRQQLGLGELISAPVAGCRLSTLASRASGDVND